METDTPKDCTDRQWLRVLALRRLNYLRWLERELARKEHWALREAADEAYKHVVEGMNGHD